MAVIVASMLCPMGAHAQSQGERSVPGDGSATNQGEGKRGQRRRFEEVWAAADKDRDGFLSWDEFLAMPRIQNLPNEQRQRIFKRLDKNGDGRISREELAPSAQPHEGAGQQMLHLWELDVDKSGGISFEEFKASRMVAKLSAEKQAELFRRLDANHDGRITPEDKPEHPFKREGASPLDPRMNPRHLIRRLDQNADGALSLEEFRAGFMVKDLSADQQQAIFNVLDRNHDQRLTIEDFPAPPPIPGGESKPPAATRPESSPGE